MSIETTESQTTEEALSPGQDPLLEQILASLPILADVSRADLLLYRYTSADRAVIVGQAQPHSILPLYSELLLQREVTRQELPAIFAPLERFYRSGRSQAAAVNGAHIVRQVSPMRDAQGRVTGALSVEINVLAYERHRRRNRAFRRALWQLQGTALRGELCGVETLMPFGEHDGLYFVDMQRRIQYVSGIAANFFRRLSYMENLVGQRVGSLVTSDPELVEKTLGAQRCFEQESEEQGQIWIRKSLPVCGRREWALLGSGLGLPPLASTDSYPVGVLVAIHDATDARRQEQEIKVKMALLQEVHHRVKNNLQTIASLLRLQSRRVDSPEAREILQESINRILSIAVVHEFLSQGGNSAINIKDIGRRIVGQMNESLSDPNKRIEFEVEGPTIHLPARQATACALVMNELLQNASEHGFQSLNEGKITLVLVDEGESVKILVRDNGEGLPANFSLSEGSNLGLRIVQALVHDDLHGRFALTSEPWGTQASVTFAKQLADGGRI